MTTKKDKSRFAASRSAFRVVSALMAQLLIVLPAFSASAQADADAAAATAGADAESGGLRRVFVPLEELDLVIRRDNKGVMLPRDQFQLLYEKALENVEKTPRLPRGIVLSQADYHATIVGRQLQVTATLELTQFSDRWHRLPLPFGGMGVEAAVLGDDPARIGRLNGKLDMLYLLNNQSGAHTLRLELSAPLRSVASDRIAALQLVPAPAGTLRISLPAGQQLLVDDAQLQPVETSNAESLYEAPVGGRSQIRLRITQRRAQQLSDQLLLATTAYGVNVTPGEVTWVASATLQVYGRAVDRILAEVPRTLEVTAVESSGLQSWKLADSETDENKTSVFLAYRQPFDGSRRIVIRGIMSTTPDEPWQLPNLAFNGDDSHIGRVVVRHPPGVRLRVVDLRGARATVAVQTAETSSVIRPASFETTPDDVAATAYDVWREDFTLAFVTETKSREVAADVLTSMEISSRGIDLSTIAKLRTVYAPLYSVDVHLPAEWTVTAVNVGGTPVEWNELAGEAGIRQVRVALDPPLMPGQQRQIVVGASRPHKNWPLPEEGLGVELAEVRLPQASIVEGAYVIRADEKLQVVPLEVRGLDPAYLETPGERFGYRYQDTRFSGRLSIKPKALRLSAHTLTFSRLDSQALRSHIETLLHIAGGQLTHLRIALPESTGEQLRFALLEGNARISEQSSVSRPEGERLWTLKFDRPVEDRLLLAVDVEVERGDADAHALPVLRVLEAERQNGYVAIEAAADQRLQIEARGAGGLSLDEVDPVDLPPPAGYRPRERIVAAYGYVVPGYTATLAEQKFERVAVPTAVCRQARLASILGPTGELHHQAMLRFTAVGVQSLLVELPATARLWATLIDDRPIEVRRPRAEGGYLVPLPAAEQSGQERTLSFFFVDQAGRLERSGRLQQQPPRLWAVSGGGDTQLLQILDQNWTLFYPPNLALLDSDGRFEPVDEFEQVSLLARFWQELSVGSPAELFWNTLYVLLAGGMAILLAGGFGRYGVSGLIAAGAVAAVIAAVWALLPDVQSARKAVDRRATVRDTSDAARQRGAEPAAPAPEIEKDRDDKEIEAGARVDSSLAAQQSERDKSPEPVVTATPADTRIEPGFQVLRKSTAGARLSVPVHFQPPDEARVKKFRYLGTHGGLGRAGLSLVYANQAVGLRFSLLIAAVVSFLFWMLRRRTLRQRSFLGIMGCAVPLALITVTPTNWQMVLDGLFLGSLGGVLFWSVHGIAQTLAGVSASHRRQSVAAIARLLLAAGALSFASRAAGQEGNNSAAPDVWPPSGPAGPRVVVPYETGTDPLDADRVYLPHDEFIELWNRAYPDKRVVPPAPVEGLVTAALYSAALQQPADHGSARVAFKGRIVLESFRDHQVAFRLPLGSVAMRSARLDGEPAPLQMSSETNAETGGLQLVVESPGLHVLDIEFDVAADVTGPAGEFTLPLQPVPSGRLTFVLPAEGLQVRAGDSADNYRRRTEDGRELVEIPIDASGPLTVAWRPVEEIHTANGALVYAEASTAMSVDDGGVHVNAEVNLRVQRGSINEAVFAIPSFVKISEVGGPDVAGWAFENRNEQRLLRIYLRRGITEATAVTIGTFLPLQAGSIASTIDLPRIDPQGVTREIGHIAVFSGPQFALRVKKATGLIQINPADFQPLQNPNRPGGEPQFAFRYVAQPRALTLSVVRRTPELRAVGEHGASIESRKLRITSRFTLDVEEAPRARLPIRLPEGFLPLSVEATGLSDWYVSRTDQGERVLIVDFGGPQSGAIEVALRGTISKQPDDQLVDVELPRLGDVDRLESNLVVWIDEGYSANIQQSAGWKSVDPHELSRDLQSLRPRPAQFAFYTDTLQPQAIRLKIQIRVARLQADAVTIVTVTDTSVDYTLTLQWEIAQGAADTFAFTTSGRLAGKLDFRAAGLRQVSETAVDNGRIRWVVTTQEPQRGRYFLTATATFPPPEEGDLAAPLARFTSPSADAQSVSQPLQRQRQYVVLVNQSSARLNSAAPNALERINADELPIKVRRDLVDRAAEIVRVRQLDADPLWHVRRFEQQRGAPASVNLADLVTVVERDGTWRTQAVYRIKNRSRQFLALRLPEASQTLSVFVDKRPSRAVVTRRNGERMHLVALPKTSEADLSFEVKVVLSGVLPGGPLPRDFRLFRRVLQLPAPRVLPLTDDPEFGIPVARTRWTTWFPEEIDLRPVDDHQRHNLNLTPAEEIIEELTLLQETGQLVKVLEGSYSSRTKQRALENVGRLEKQLRQQKASASAAGEQAEHARQLRSKVLGELGNALSRVQEEQAKQRAGAAAIEDAGHRFAGEQLQRAQIARQNEQLFLDNALRAQETAAIGKSDLFSLSLKTSAAPPDAASQRATDDELAIRQRRHGGLTEQRARELSRELLEQAPQNQGVPQSQQPGPTPLRGRRGMREGKAAGQKKEPMPSRSETDGAFRSAVGAAAGFGGGAGFGTSRLDEIAAADAWILPGGLSLDIELPRVGQKLVFDKVGGDPTLALLALPRKSLETSVGMLWTAVWLALGFGAFVVISRSGRVAAVGRLLPAACVVLGVLGFFLLPGLAAWIAFGLFVVGAGLLAYRHEAFAAR